MSAQIVMSVVAAEHGLSMNDMLGTRRASNPARYTAALLMERLLYLTPKQLDHEFKRRAWGHHALRAARRMLDGDRAAQARFNQLERLCRGALAGEGGKPETGETNGGSSMTAHRSLDSIIDLAKAYARARGRVSEVAEEIRDRQRRAVSGRLRALRSRAAEAGAAERELRDAVEAAPELFEKPRTQTVDGVRFGWRKQAGAIEIADEKKVIERIRKSLPDREAALVRVKETVDRTALRKLAAGDLARLGLSIGNPVDEVTIGAASSDIDKLVKALLEENQDQEEDAA